MTTITRVTAREILDSRGNPTVEAEVHLDTGQKAWSQVPSGASTGEYEAHELRDSDAARYGGKGVLKAVENVQTQIDKAIRGMHPEEQRAVDHAMTTLDGTSDKSNLGANAILAVSLAVCRAGAATKGEPLYKHIQDLHGTKELTMPMPMFNVINGGKHADSGLAIQEYKVVPTGISTYKEQLRAGSEIFHALKAQLHGKGHTTAVGDEGGFAPRLGDNAAPLTEIQQAVTSAGYKMGADVEIAIDAAASSFYYKHCGHYAFKLEDRALSTEDLLAVYKLWTKKHHVFSIEDGFDEHDWEAWQQLTKALGKKTMLIGDDLLVTNTTRLQQAIDQKACNAVLIKPNQIGTVSETLACMKLAQEHDFQTIVSHRSGDTIDDFIADLAVGAGAGYIKTGSLSRAERLSKYNRLLRIAQDIES